MNEYKLLAKIVACPVCSVDLPIKDADTQVICHICGSTFMKERYIWNFIPTIVAWSSPMWQTWQQVQANGMVGYQCDPEHNLAVGARQDSQDFALFCNCHGLVLDVGCGPQSWPSYFNRTEETTYVGIDPLVQDVPEEFLRFRGLAEFLPFRTGVFDQVLFATALDHFVDPAAALKGAARVCKSTGEIDIWIGEKIASAPNPAVSPEWYRQLRKPDLAEDLFHIKRWSGKALIDLAIAAGLTLAQTEAHTVDKYRTNYFYRLKLAGGQGRR